MRLSASLSCLKTRKRVSSLLKTEQFPNFSCVAFTFDLGFYFDINETLFIKVVKKSPHKNEKAL